MGRVKDKVQRFWHIKTCDRRLLRPERSSAARCCACFIYIEWSKSVLIFRFVGELNKRLSFQRSDTTWNSRLGATTWILVNVVDRDTPPTSTGMLEAYINQTFAHIRYVLFEVGISVSLFMETHNIELCISTYHRNHKSRGRQVYKSWTQLTAMFIIASLQTPYSLH